METKSKRKYTEQTKKDAVGQVIGAQLPMNQVAKAFDMPVQTLENWVRLARHGKSPKAGALTVSQTEAELTRLRAQCARLTMERDILKKATAYFAKDAL